MSSPNSSVRQRVGKEKSKVNGKVDQAETEIKNVYESAKQNVSKEWDYKVAISIITFLAFATRFTGISHPNEVVFDEVHFGKVRDCVRAWEVLLKYTSSHPTTCNDYTSSMSTLPLRNFYLPLLAG